MALGIQHAVRMRRIVISVACRALQYISTLHYARFSKKEKLLNIKRVF